MTGNASRHIFHKFSCPLRHFLSDDSTQAWNLQQPSSPGGKAAAAPKLDGTSGGGVVNVDSEESLLVVRASAGSADASVGGPHLSASVAVGRFEIEDLLVGARCPAHRYLARSFEAPPGSWRTPGWLAGPLAVLGSVCEHLSIVVEARLQTEWDPLLVAAILKAHSCQIAADKVEEEQDEFLDAREELSVRSPSTASSRSDLFVDAEGPSELEQAGSPPPMMLSPCSPLTF